MEREKEPLPYPLKLTKAVRLAYPAAREILGSFPDRWELIHQLFRDDTPLYIAGLPPSEEQAPPGSLLRPPARGEPGADDLSTAQVLPALAGAYHLGVLGRSCRRGSCRGDAGLLNIRLQSLGQAQAWYGREVGVIWESFMPKPGRGENWEEELTTFWEQVEQDIGVAKIYTEPHEPTFEEGYTDFLAKLGYAPDPDHPRWWSKARRRW